MRNDSSDESSNNGSDDNEANSVASNEMHGGDNSMLADRDDSVEELDDKVMSELLDGDDDDDSGIRDSSGDSSSSHSTNEEEDNTQLNYVYENPPDDSIFGRKTLCSEQRKRIQNVERATTKVIKVIEKYGNAPLPSLDPNDASNEHGWEIPADSAWSNPSLAVKEIVNAREELIGAWGTGDEEGKQIDKDSGCSTRASSQKVEWWEPILTNSSSTNNESGEGSQNITSANNEDDELLTGEDQEQFQAVHMEWATTAFAEELELLRKGQLDTLASNKRKQNKNASGRRGAEQQRDPSSGVELDPTQYSFVVSSNDKNKAGDNANENAAVTMEDIDLQILADMLQSGSNFLSNTEKKMLLGARQRAMTSMDVVDKGDGFSLHERRKRELGFVVE
mmetsp:Transcript_15638/g.33012  ORF Transcript_15638/g.33012 Transcript_15638/m.33012 type:complete len:393 (+) Transcript_15638:133-1311(+)